MISPALGVGNGPEDDQVASPDDVSDALLVVGGEPEMRNYLARSLRPHFARIDCAGDVVEARAIARRSRIDFLIADLGLSGPASGPTLARELREQSNVDLDAVYISGLATWMPRSTDFATSPRISLESPSTSSS